MAADMSEMAKQTTLETAAKDEKTEEEKEAEEEASGVSNTRKKGLIAKQTRLQVLTKNNSGRKCRKKVEGTYQKTKTINLKSSKKKKLGLRAKFQPVKKGGKK